MKSLTVDKLLNQQDIRYRGVLSYRYLRIIAWIMMICSQAAIMCGAAIKIYGTSSPNIQSLYSASSLLSMLGNMALPLFLVANFSLILSSNDDILKTLIKNVGLTFVIYIVFFLFYERYLVGFISIFDPTGGQAAADSFLRAYFSQYLSFNVFIDLVMCTLTCMFIVYNPKKYFQGNKIIIFRLLVLIPILYEIACFVIKGLSNGQMLFEIPVLVLPILTNKPLVTYFAFLAIVLFVKIRKNRFFSLGGNNEQYETYLSTNRNSFYFSLFVAVAFIVAALVDTLVYKITYQCLCINDKTYDWASAEGLVYFNSYMKCWGIGKAGSFYIIAPLMLLFSYTKKHDPKTKLADLFIPVGGISLCVLTYLEGFLQILLNMPK